jgi:hypothetical protein
MKTKGLWSESPGSMITRNGVCRECGVSFTYDTSEKSGTRVRCRPCARIKEQADRGRNIRQMAAMSSAPPVKIYSRKEIELIASQLSVPRRLQKYKYVSGF